MLACIVGSFIWVWWLRGRAAKTSGKAAWRQKWAEKLWEELCFADLFLRLCSHHCAFKVKTLPLIDFLIVLHWLQPSREGTHLQYKHRCKQKCNKSAYFTGKRPRCKQKYKHNDQNFSFPCACACVCITFIFIWHKALTLLLVLASLVKTRLFKLETHLLDRNPCPCTKGQEKYQN